MFRRLVLCCSCPTATPPAPGTGYTTLPNPVVTFEVGEHGDTVDPAEVVFSYTATAPTPSAAGCDFTGWYTDAAFTTPYDFATPVTADLAHYGGWAVAADLLGGAQPVEAVHAESH